MENLPDNESPAELYRKRLRELASKISDDKIVEYFDVINTRVSEWRANFGEDITDYELYHILIGSTPKEGQNFRGLDLPGGEMAAFVGELENKYTKG